ncbi:hypothetical protein [Marivirga sp.]|uniref:hypothetical protein n=1 Tax=Marivirga sp. TaxID=2018662 RepID=UPI002D800474|nr:hypothetical protein [Marivirga sp.]HET8859599.1 hypothetical protein [Marivirga sp.]
MKKLKLSGLIVLHVLTLVACNDDSVSPMQKVEVEVGEAFMINGHSQLNFTNFDESDLKIEVKGFSDHIVNGLVTQRIYVDVDIIDNNKTNHQVEAGYEDICLGQSTGGNCNELRFEMKDQVFFLRFEEVYWSEVKQNKDGVEYIEVDSSQLIVERQ